MPKLIIPTGLDDLFYPVAIYTADEGASRNSLGTVEHLIGTCQIRIHPTSGTWFSFQRETELRNLRDALIDICAGLGIK